MDEHLVLPGLEAMAATVRESVRALFKDHPRCEDAVLIANELATNAIRHSPAGDPDGTFELRIHTVPGAVRISVTDPGHHAWKTPERDELDDGGRGLAIVLRLADNMGFTRTAHSTTAWAELTWSTHNQTN